MDQRPEVGGYLRDFPVEAHASDWIDIRTAALQDHGAETWSRLTAKDLMTADPITVQSDVLVVKALAQMEHNRRKPISVLPVVNQEHQLMGLLRLHDLVQAGLA